MSPNTTPIADTEHELEMVERVLGPDGTRVPNPDLDPFLSANEARVKVSGPAQPHARLGVYQARYWRGPSSPTLPGVNTGYTMAEIWQDILAVADATYGAPNGYTD